jgi:hypothetical protein
MSGDEKISNGRVQKENEYFDLPFVVPGVAIGLAIVRICQYIGRILVYKILGSGSNFLPHGR